MLPSFLQCKSQADLYKTYKVIAGDELGVTKMRGKVITLGKLPLLRNFGARSGAGLWLEKM